MIDKHKLKEIKTALKPAIDYSYQKVVSYSQYQVFAQCPHRFKTQYIDKNRVYEPSIYAVFGTAIHEAIQHYLELMYEKSVQHAEELDIYEYFQEKFIEEYNKTYEKNNNVHFSSSEEMREFYEDGESILRYLKFHRPKYFGLKGWELLGIELPLLVKADDDIDNVFVISYLDVVLYNKDEGKVYIYDIKTSTRGWSQYVRKDPLKARQLILYKIMFAKRFGVPVENIEVEFLIVKRKLYENLDFPQKKIQQFAPPSGKNKRTKTQESFDEFLQHCFNPDGSYNKENEYEKKPDKHTCRFCPFLNDKGLCDKGIKG